MTTPPTMSELSQFADTVAEELALFDSGAIAADDVLENLRTDLKKVNR